MSIIASNCNGSCILHDLGVRFNSPFVNLWVKPQDFIKMLTNLEHYMSCELLFVKEKGLKYPVGKLDDVFIYFQHYKTELEAKVKWKERVKRIDYSNLFVMFTDRDNCTESDLMDFDRLPYEKKVVFVHKNYPNIKSSFVIKGFEKSSSVGILSEYKNDYSYKRYYNDFDFVKWFNSKKT